MSGQIFISYRREESRWSAGRLYDRLIARFDPKQIFMDINGIRPGADFVTTIEQKVSECDVLVAVIGERWLTSSDGEGGRRLDTEQREKERFEAEQREKQRLEAEAREKRLNAEQSEKQRLAAQKRDKEQVEAEQREWELLDTERREKERLAEESRQREETECITQCHDREQREREKAEVHERQEEEHLDARRPENGEEEQLETGVPPRESEGRERRGEEAAPPIPKPSFSRVDAAPSPVADRTIAPSRSLGGTKWLWLLAGGLILITGIGGIWFTVNNERTVALSEPGATSTTDGDPVAALWRGVEERNVDKAIRLNPKYAEAYRHRGIVYKIKGQLDKAEADFAKANELEKAGH